MELEMEGNAMAKLAIAGGILLMILSFVLLFLFVIVSSGTTNSGVNQMKGALVCGEGETYSETLGDQVTDEFGRNAGAIFTATCTAADGTTQNVTERAIVIMGASFVLPFVGGLLLALSGGIALARGRRDSSEIYPFEPHGFEQGGFTSASTSRSYESSGATSFDFDIPAVQRGNATYVTMTGGSLDQLPPEARETVNRILQGLGGASLGSPASSGDDLAGRLEQLEEARRAGLISAQEYEQVRQKILDDIGG
jgi:hypothetical protein